MTFKALLKSILSHLVVEWFTVLELEEVWCLLMYTHTHTHTHTLQLVIYWFKQQYQNKTQLLEIVYSPWRRSNFHGNKPTHAYKQSLISKGYVRDL